MLPSTKSGVPRELSDSFGLSGQYLVDEPFLPFTQVLLACFFLAAGFLSFSLCIPPKRFSSQTGFTFTKVRSMKLHVKKGLFAESQRLRQGNR
jgi:hypothetical protein